MDPTTAQHIRETFDAAIWFLGALVSWLYLSHRSAEHGPTNWAKWKMFLRTRYLVTSSKAGSEPARTGSVGGSIDPVRPDAHQVEPGEPAEKSDALVVAVSHKMSDKELTLLMAAQTTDDGKNRWSANDIVRTIGGTRQEVLDWVAIIRPRDRVEPVPEAPAAASPIAGRPYDPSLFHSDNPDLQYQEP